MLKQFKIHNVTVEKVINKVDEHSKVINDVSKQVNTNTTNIANIN